jgi:hypothetical protein
LFTIQDQIYARAEKACGDSREKFDSFTALRVHSTRHYASRCWEMQDESRGLETLSMLPRLNHEVIVSFSRVFPTKRLTAHNGNVALSLETQLTFREDDCTTATATLPCFVLTFRPLRLFICSTKVRQTRSDELKFR